MNKLQQLLGVFTGRLQATEGSSRPTDPLSASLQYPFADSTQSRFITYSSQVNEIDRRYNAKSQFGNHLVKTIIDYRAAWIAGNGASFKAKGDREQAFLDRFVEYNFLDTTFFRELEEEAEIEGKQLLYLVARQNELGEIDIDLKQLSWIATNYHVVTSGDDYETILRVTMGEGGKDLPGIIPETSIYVKFGGSRRCVNETPPALAYVLWDIDSLDRAMDDFRKINHKYGAAWPYWETSGPDGLTHARIITSTLRGEKAEGQNAWRIGHSMAAPAKAYYVEPSGAGAEQLQKEIIRHATIVSAGTGVPIHFLGYVELMSNRATAEELLEQVNAMTAGPRTTWTSKLKETAQKAMQLYSAVTGEILNYDDVTVTIPPVTLAQIQALISVYLPLHNAGAFSKESLIEHIPGIDVEREKERIAAEEKATELKAKERFNQMASAGAANMPIGGDDDAA